MLLFAMMYLGKKWPCLEDCQFHVASAREKPRRDRCLL